MKNNIEVDILIDEYAAGKLLLKREKSGEVKGYVKRVAEKLKALGFTSEQIKKKSKAYFDKN